MDRILTPHICGIILSETSWLSLARIDHTEGPESILKSEESGVLPGLYGTAKHFPHDPTPAF